MNIDKNTGLPELPKGKAWKIDRSPYSDETLVVVGIVRKYAYYRHTSNLHYREEDDPHKALEEMCKQEYGDRFEGITDVKLSRDTGPNVGFWKKKPAWTTEYVSGRVKISDWQTIFQSGPVDPTPQHVLNAALELMQQADRDEDARKLCGLYPPNKLEDD